jgi:hypothetical protein
MTCRSVVHYQCKLPFEAVVAKRTTCFNIQQLYIFSRSVLISVFPVVLETNRDDIHRLVFVMFAHYREVFVRKY